MPEYITARRLLYVGVAVLLFCVLAVGAVAGCKSFNRYQRRADANNSVTVERLKVGAVKQRAEQRYQESVGIKRAQDEINSTLTPLYVQHEAIQAQRAALNDGNAQIYIPSGNQGVPLVREVSPDTGTGAR